MTAVDAVNEICHRFVSTSGLHLNELGFLCLAFATFEETFGAAFLECLSHLVGLIICAVHVEFGLADLI